jgi:hypothetical protein
MITASVSITLNTSLRLFIGMVVLIGISNLNLFLHTANFRYTQV